MGHQPSNEMQFIEYQRRQQAYLTQMASQEQSLFYQRQAPVKQDHFSGIWGNSLFASVPSGLEDTPVNGPVSGMNQQCM